MVTVEKISIDLFILYLLTDQSLILSSTFLLHVHMHHLPWNADICSVFYINSMNAWVKIIWHKATFCNNPFLTRMSYIVLLVN